MTEQEIFEAIQADPQNVAFSEAGVQPLYHVDANAELLIISQAPSRRAQASMVFWDDPSGDRLRDWLGVSRTEFYDSGKVAVLPLDFYYPGKCAHGDLPPRKGFAEKWHAPLLAMMPNVKLTLLIGQYAQAFYLGDRRQRNLTETVAHFEDYLPDFFPIVHPSPLNLGWLKRNSWFEQDVIPALQGIVRPIFEDKP